MHAKPRTLPALISLLIGVVSAACGGPGPPVCTACNYKTATFTITSGQLNHGTIGSATMHTEVVHPSCPYAGFNSPCTATLDMNVLCVASGAGTFTIKKRPNGYSAGATAVTTLSLVVNLPGGGTSTVPVAVTMGTPDSTTQVAVCSSPTTPTITD
jgi:hypothetical protein